MSAGCLRPVLSRAVRVVCGGGGGCWTPSSRFLICSEMPNNIAPSWRFSLFSTAADDSGESLAPKKKKQDPRARATISSVGRKINQRQLQVIGETGEDLGAMHRADAIRLMDEQGLKLVLVNEHKDPPIYRLMSGKQIHEERLKLREKQKAKAGPVQVKELTFSSDIGSHDLTTKLKQVQSWLEKKHHVKITMRSRRADPTVSLDVTLEQVVQQLEVTVGYVSKPTVIRDGQAATCVLRPPSAKELAQKRQKEQTAGRSAESSSQPDTSLASPVHDADGSTPQ